MSRPAGRARARGRGGRRRRLRQAFRPGDVLQDRLRAVPRRQGRGGRLRRPGVLVPRLRARAADPARPDHRVRGGLGPGRGRGPDLRSPRARAGARQQGFPAARVLEVGGVRPLERLRHALRRGHARAGRRAPHHRGIRAGFLVQRPHAPGAVLGPGSLLPGRRAGRRRAGRVAALRRRRRRRPRGLRRRRRGLLRAQAGGRAGAPEHPLRRQGPTLAGRRASRPAPPGPPRERAPRDASAPQGLRVGREAAARRRALPHAPRAGRGDL